MRFKNVIITLLIIFPSLVFSQSGNTSSHPLDAPSLIAQQRPAFIDQLCGARCQVHRTEEIRTGGATRVAIQDIYVGTGGIPKTMMPYEVWARPKGTDDYYKQITGRTRGLSVLVSTKWDADYWIIIKDHQRPTLVHIDTDTRSYTVFHGCSIPLTRI